MAGNIFRKRFGRDPRSFRSTEEVDTFVEQKTGRKMKVRLMHPNLVTRRGFVFPTKKTHADKTFKKALAE